MKIYTPDQIAEMCFVSVATVLSSIRKGELRASNWSRNPMSRKPRYRITEEALTDFLRAREVSPPTARRRKKRPTTNRKQFIRED